MASNVTMLITGLGKQHLAQQDRMTVNAEESCEFIDKLGAADDAAREAGDDAGLTAAVNALQRVADGERADVVYLEWLRAQGARGGEG